MSTDNGIKKLWSRTRSKRKGSQSEAGPRLATSASFSKGHTYSVSTNVPPSSHESGSIPNSRGIHSPLALREPGSPRPATGSTIQPMLVGVSRPTTSASRPGTSGSLQNAVTEAADAVSQEKTQSPKESEVYRKTHTRTNTPKYVDIFSITNVEPSKGIYNEDIATRNLDVGRVVDETPRYRYIPLSKFQEEVATRNAYPPLQQKRSLDLHSPDRKPLNILSAVTRDGPTATTTSPNHGYVHHSPRSSDVPSVRLPNDSTAYHSRQYAARSREQASQLPAIPQENVNDSAGVKAQSMVDIKKGSAMPLEDVQTPNKSKEGGLGLLYVPPASRFVRSSLQKGPQAVSNGQEKRHSKGASSEHSKRSEYSNFRPSSALSTTSSVRRAINLNNRTIMDLTGDDSEVFSDGYASSDFLDSPVLENATADPVRRMQPSIIIASSRYNSSGDERKSKPVSVPPQPTIAERRRSPNRESIARITSWNMAPKDNIHPTATSSFSPINTLVSVSPQIKAAEIEQTSSRPQDIASNGVSNLPTSDLSSERLDVPSPEPLKIRGYGKKTHLAPKTDRRDRVNIKPLTQTEVKSKAPLVRGVPAASSRSEVSKQKATTIGNTTDIHQAPSSLDPSDLSSSSQATGVVTRDFAAPPKKKTIVPITLQSEKSDLSNGAPNRAAIGVAPKVSTSSRRTARSKVLNTDKPLPAPSPYLSTFDEEAFARKREAARAALLRLQSSLDEGYVNSTPAKPEMNRTQSGTSEKNDKPTGSLESKRDRTIDGDPTSNNMQATPSAADILATIPTIKTTEPTPKDKGKGKQREKEVLMRGQPTDELQETRLFLPFKNLDDSNRVPPSPGEVSLSSFPIPIGSPPKSTVISEVNQSPIKRRPSVRSQASNASAFSIPHHMIPDRSSSRRDQKLAREEDLKE